jgi:uncharacterized protein YwbE
VFGVNIQLNNRIKPFLENKKCIRTKLNISKSQGAEYKRGKITRGTSKSFFYAYPFHYTSYMKLKVIVVL